MENYSIFGLLVQYPWLLGVLVIVVVIILMLPDEVRVVTRSGRAYHRWRGLLWEYTAEPGERRLRLLGLRRLQRTLLGWLRMQWWQGHGELRRWLAELLWCWMQRMQ